MTARSFRIVFVLLSLATAGTLAIQGYWLITQYKSEKAGFDRTVYDCLDVLSQRLNELKSIGKLNNEFVVKRIPESKTPRKKKKKNERVFISEKKMVISSNGSSAMASAGVTDDSIFMNGYRDLSIQIDENGKERVSVFSDGSLPSQMKQFPKGSIEPEPPDTVGLSILVGKLFEEIRLIDDHFADTASVRKVMTEQFQRRGLTLPFEFKYVTGTDSFASRSFNPRSSAFTSDLSGHRILKSKDRLSVQFPTMRQHVLAGLEGSMVIAAVFSSIVLILFYSVIRLILRQKKLSEMKSDFMNNMTHELKTPIATIALATDAMRNPSVRNNDEQYTEYLRILREENRKLDDRVERALQMAMMDKGTLLMQRKKVQVDLLLNEILNSHRLMTEACGADIRTAIHPELWVEGDPSHLSGVFSNLLDNALKYSGQGARISIEAYKNGGDVEVLFVDNGIGISRDDQEKVFDRFYRVQGGLQHDVKGFGLGLSYVRSVVEAHGGKVLVASEPGHGSRFTVILKQYEQDTAG